MPSSPGGSCQAVGKGKLCQGKEWAPQSYAEWQVVAGSAQHPLYPGKDLAPWGSGSTPSSPLLLAGLAGSWMRHGNLLPHRVQVGTASSESHAGQQAGHAAALEPPCLSVGGGMPWQGAGKLGHRHMQLMTEGAHSGAFLEA